MRLRSGWRLVGAVILMVCGISWAQGLKTITVGAAGADFTTIQSAVNAAPDAGAVIRIRPGVYREVVHVDKPKIQLRGDADDWTKVVLVYGNSAASTCGTGCSATLFVTGDDFYAGNMTIANDYSKTTMCRRRRSHYHCGLTGRCCGMFDFWELRIRCMPRVSGA